MDAGSVKVSPKDELLEYYQLVKNRHNETPDEKERRFELYLSLQDEYTHGYEPLDERVEFNVTEGEYEYYGYVLYSDDGLMLYIGITKDPRVRWRQHLKDKHVALMKVVVGGSYYKIYEWEKREIERWLPPLNRRLYENGEARLCWDLADEVAMKYIDVPIED